MNARFQANATFQELLAEAVRDIGENGISDPVRLDQWLRRLRIAAIADLPSLEETMNQMQRALNAAFTRATSDSAILKYHPGIPRFTLHQIRPALRVELDRRILANANLIKISRDEAVEKTLRRLSGWATSIPVGGSDVEAKREIREHIAEPVKNVRYQTRLRQNDQSHKLVSAVNAVIAQQSGAIAAKWRSHWRRPGYQYRKDHKERDEKIYAIRGSWAMEQGLINKGDGYTDDITEPAQEVNCTCYYVYLNSLRELPEAMLTPKGKKVLEETRLKRTANA
jgi:hypothetical protein